MPRVSYAFFILGALCGLTGMAWGMWMGASQDFTTAPAHAHLNLLGWLGLSVMGGFQALAERYVARGLAWVNLALSTAGAVLLPVGIASIMLGVRAGEPFAFIGGGLAIAGMLSFLGAVLTAAARSRR